MRTITLIFACLMTLTCLSQSRRAPDWVHQSPLSDQVYYGIGYANPEIHSNPKQYARQMALRDMAEKILVSIDASSELKVLSINTQISFQLDETVKMTSSSFLSGYEQLGEWTNRKQTEYYVLFRLDKSIYRQNLENYYDQLFDLIDLKSAYAEKQVAEGQMMVGINELAARIEKLLLELDGVIDPTYAKMIEIRKLALIHQLESYLARIRFDLQSEYLVDFSDPNPFVMKDFVVDHITGTPIHNLDMELLSLKGDVFAYAFQQNTLHDALAIKGFFPINGEAVIQLKAKPSLSASVTRLLDPTLLASLNSTEVKLSFLPYAIQIVTRDQDDHSLANYIRVITNDLGLIETDEGPQLKVIVNASHRSEKLRRSKYQAFFEGDIQIFSANEDIPDFAFRMEGKSEVMSSKRSAVQSAYGATIENPVTFLSGFVTHLCTK